MDIKEKIRVLREKHDLSQEQMAKIADVSPKTISTYENGTRSPQLKTVGNICRHFHLDINSFVDEKTPLYDVAPHDPIMHRIPILGEIAAGLPLYAEQHIEDYTWTELNGGAEYFALRVKGDSMTAARIFDGDMLIVRRQEEVDNGEIAVVMVDNENATVKRFYRTGDTVTLVPQSNDPAHQPQVYDVRSTPVTIIGKVVQNPISF